MWADACGDFALVFERLESGVLRSIIDEKKPTRRTPVVLTRWLIMREMNV
jgi:hypothetical protein